MNNYDFKSLNDKEFEALACDLVGLHFTKKFERFKPGRDSGVDGRFFTSENQEVVLQCKHWANTPISQLFTQLSKFERPKVAKIKPALYIIAVSNSLSRKDKSKIKIALSPYMKSEALIFGAEDLNDLLSQYKDIEQRHYKLWLHSAGVLSHMMDRAILGRSACTLEEIKKDTKKYAVTENHQRALAQLEQLRVVIVTGEPGIGKTTLANHLCLHYTVQGYQLLVISEDIEEAESVLDVETKQIFYFDDFLGRNYLEALTGHEGKKITQFIKQIANNDKKRFILTSRSTILNQAKILIDLITHNNLQKNEYEMRFSSLSEIDKAHILYNQIWHSNLHSSHVNEIYKDGRYRNVISHKNYNPRLISHVTDANRLDNIPLNGYWKHIEESLNNPAGIWENPFDAQQDDFGRGIILLVVLNRQPIAEAVLAEAYQDYISLPGNQNLKGRADFLINLKSLTGSFLNRIIDGDKVKIDLFNPSIGDYVLGRYKANPTALKNGFICLRNTNSLNTLKNLQQNNIIGRADSEIIAAAMLERLAHNDLGDVSFVSDLIRVIIYSGVPHGRIQMILKQGARHVLERTHQTDSTRNAFFVVQEGVKLKWIDEQEALNFIRRLAHFIVADEEIKDCWSLICSLENKDTYHCEVRAVFIKEINNHINKSIARFIHIDRVFRDCNAAEYGKARHNLVQDVKEKIISLGLNPEEFDLNYFIIEYDIERAMKNYFNSISSIIPQEIPIPNASGSSTDQIEDLFDRS